MKAKTFFLITGASVLTFFGIKAYREIQALKTIAVVPAQVPFSLVGISGDIVSGLLKLVFTNPSSFKVEVEKFRMDLFFHGELLAKVSPVNVTINSSGKTFFSFPTAITTSKLLRLGRDILSRKSGVVNFKGSLVFKSQTFGVSVHVPVEFDVDVKEEINRFLKEKAITPLILL